MPMRVKLELEFPSFREFQSYLNQVGASQATGVSVQIYEQLKRRWEAEYDEAKNCSSDGPEECRYDYE